MGNPYPASFENTQGARRLTGQIDFTDPANQPGGAQLYVRVELRHSADFANVNGSAPVVATQGTGTRASTELVLPPSAMGNNSTIYVQVFNQQTTDVDMTGTLVVQSGDGTVWIEQDIPSGTTQTIAAQGSAVLDFSLNGGSAGVGLSWNTVTKRIDIASAGVYSAFVYFDAVPA